MSHPKPLNLSKTTIQTFQKRYTTFLYLKGVTKNSPKTSDGSMCRSDIFLSQCTYVMLKKYCWRTITLIQYSLRIFPMSRHRVFKKNLTFILLFWHHCQRSDEVSLSFFFFLTQSHRRISEAVLFVTFMALASFILFRMNQFS